MWSKLTKNDRNIKEIVVDFVFNGALGLFVFYLLQYTFLLVTPTSWYFDYSSVEPYTVPAYISNEYIEMQSTLQIDRDGEMEWNDVLRCISPSTGYFNYVGEYNTRSAFALSTDGVVKSKWQYRGKMPQSPALCRMDSTITRHLQFGIKKQQFIQSSVFKIEL